MTDVQLFVLLLPKVCVALIAGLIVGVERERKHKAAGIKTLTLICIGAMLFTIVAEQAHDLGHIIAQIIPGIGFLGAGAIMRPSGDRVSGLTTAAIIWTMAAIGVLIGLGFVLVPLSLSLLIAAATTAISLIERKLFPTQSDTKNDPS